MPSIRSTASTTPELAGERREPVVPVGEHDDLAVVADLEELLDAAVHVADDRLAVDDPLAVEGQPQPEDAVGGRMLRADVEDHVLGREATRLPAAALVPCRGTGGEARCAVADPDDDRSRLPRCHVGHPCTVSRR